MTDKKRILENQFSKTFSFKGCTQFFKYGLEYLIAVFTEDQIPQKDIANAIKKI